ncbi:MAG: YceI family protein [Saprospiraceae bacterium]|nr:YceI family protein [Saprospiraceae bacterium]
MARILSISFLFVLMISQFSCKEKTTEKAEVAGTAAAHDGTKYVVDIPSAIISWIGSKPAGKHAGTIKISDGSLYVNDGKISSGHFTIDITSIAVTDLQGEDKLKLEQHLKGTGDKGATDFFNSTKYPTANFEIVKLETTSTDSNSNTMVTGNLTMLDITKSVTFPANITVSDNNVSVNTLPFTINRTDWGIKYGSKSFFDNLADKFIEDNITLQVSLSATKKSEQ